MSTARMSRELLASGARYPVCNALQMVQTADPWTHLQNDLLFVMPSDVAANDKLEDVMEGRLSQAHNHIHLKRSNAADWTASMTAAQQISSSARLQVVCFQGRHAVCPADAGSM